MQEPRGKRREMVGGGIANKMEKTITVQVERVSIDPWFGKRLKKYSKFKAHDEKREAQVGDTVRIIETRPLSKTKRWRLVKIVKTAAKEDRENT